jgi:vacuolar protein sorting-associated protein 13A/C
MIGSLALLGSPLNLASKIGCGLSNLINLPADGFEGEGVLGVGKGLALGTGSLLSNTLEGAFGTVESITGTIGNGISGFASYDKNF